MDSDIPKAIETPIGILVGRDAIFLDYLGFERPTLEMRGEFNGRLASRVERSGFIGYSIKFLGVLAFKSIELDLWSAKAQYVSSFQEVNHSSWLTELCDEAKSSHKHFQFVTYDDVVDIICSGYELQMTESDS